MTAHPLLLSSVSTKKNPDEKKGCPKGCTDHFTYDDMKEIHDIYWQ